MRAPGRRRTQEERDAERAERDQVEQFARVSFGFAAAFMRFYFNTAMPRTPPRTATHPAEHPATYATPHGDDLDALGLAAMPDAEGLRAAWRETARRTHPDAGGSAEAFQYARAAYERLARAVGA